MLTTPGRFLVDEALPEGFKKLPGPLDKKGLGNLFTRLAKEKPELYVDTLQKMNELGRRATTFYGGPAGIGLKDVMAPPKAAAAREAFRAKILGIQERDDLTPEQKRETIIKETSAFTTEMDKNLGDEMKGDRDNALALQLASGSRGSPMAMRQMLIGNMLSVDSQGRVVGWPGLEGYGEGLSPLSYWSAAHGGRKGAVDLQMATADSGYLAKQAVNIAHRQVVTSDDCGAKGVGLSVDGDDPDNVGSILAKDVGGLKAGTLLTADHLPLLGGNKISVRSPITCQMSDGVCSKCCGIREKNSFPEIGSHVGINAVRSFLEPLTQDSISSKHKGGDAAASKLSAFKQVNQLLQVPDEFQEGAVLARNDGRVNSVKEAPQGGWNVIIDNETHHVPQDRPLKIKAGDSVEAGDQLSEGMPNPSELIGHKGVGQTRKIFLDTLRGVLKAGNASTNRRNLELLSRAFVSKVRIDSPEGFDGHIVDDVADYDNMSSRWQPRAEAQQLSPQQAKGMHLEAPVMHYSIGTRITPKVADEMKESGVTSIMAHKSPPPFSPEIVRAKDYSNYDKDWLVRMAGENLRKSFIAGASQGIDSNTKGTSYYPQVANIASVDTGASGRQDQNERG